MSNPKPITTQNNESINSTENNLMTYRDELAREVSSRYYTEYIEGIY